METFIAQIDAFQRWKHITASEKGDCAGLEKYTLILGEQTGRCKRCCPRDLGIQQASALSLNLGMNISVPAQVSIVVWRRLLGQFFSLHTPSFPSHRLQNLLDAQDGEYDFP